MGELSGALVAAVLSSSVIAALVAALLNHYLSGRTRREEREYAAKLRDDQEERELRRSLVGERRARLAGLRAVWAELGINAEICGVWVKTYTWDLVGHNTYGDDTKPIAEFKHQSFDSARPYLTYLPHEVRTAVSKAYAQASVFERMTRHYALSDNPDYEVMTSTAVETGNRITAAINLLAAHLMADTLWEEELLGNAEPSETEEPLGS